MNFASISSVQIGEGAPYAEQAARRLWMKGGGEWFAETASRIREQIDAVPWVNRIEEPRGYARQV